MLLGLMLLPKGYMTMKQKFFLILVVCVIPGFAMADQPSPDQLTATSEALADFKADRPDFSSDNKKFADAIDYELQTLRRIYKHTTVNLEDAAVRKIAPKVTTFVVKAVELVVERAGIAMPGVRLLLADNNLQYNAAAQHSTQTKTTIKQTYKVYYNPENGREIRRELVNQEKEIEKNAINDIVIGAELVRLFIWRSDRVALLGAIIGHEVGHIVFEHSEETVGHEHEADLFAAKLLKNGTDLITALDMLSLAAHSYNSLKDIITDKRRLFDSIRATVNRVVMDVPDLGELGTATSHAYVATAIFNALRQADQKAMRGGNLEDSCFEIYQAMKRACTVPSVVFGVPKEEIAALCLEMERKASYLHTFKNTHPTPMDRNAFIAAVSAPASS